MTGIGLITKFKRIDSWEAGGKTMKGRGPVWATKKKRQER